MILRRSFLRSSQCIRGSIKVTRCLATERDLVAIEEDIQNIQATLHSLSTVPGDVEHQQEPDIQSVQQIGPQTSFRQQLLNDGTKQRWDSRRRQEKRTKQLGTTLTPHYEPFKLLTHPPSPSDITLELLLASQTHLGHKTTHWHPGNSQYIFGIRQGIHVISLDVTAAHLRRACRVVRKVTERGGLVLFVGTRRGQERCVIKAAQLAEGYHCFNRWMSGAITNRNQILGHCQLKALDQYDRPIEDKVDRLKDVAAMKPDLVICLNPRENWVLLHECGLQMIPTIGIIDTDTNPTWVTYPIPANDDSLRCVQTIAGILGRAGQEGQRRRKEAALEGHIPYSPLDMTKKPFEERPSATARAGGMSEAKNTEEEDILEWALAQSDPEAMGDEEMDSIGSDDGLPEGGQPSMDERDLDADDVDAVPEPRSRSRASKRTEHETDSR